jgi:hypothetical protein
MSRALVFVMGRWPFGGRLLRADCMIFDQKCHFGRRQMRGPPFDPSCRQAPVENAPSRRIARRDAPGAPRAAMLAAHAVTRHDFLRTPMVVQRACLQPLAGTGSTGVGLSLLLLLLSSSSSSSSAFSCIDTATQNPSPARALAMATYAVQEHQAFGGQAMDAEGRMTVRRATRRPRTRATPSPAAAPWQRVLGYWQAVDRRRLPTQVRYGALRPANRHLLMEALNEATAGRLQGMGVGPDEGLESTELRAVQVARSRVSIDRHALVRGLRQLAREAGRAGGRRVRVLRSACRLRGRRLAGRHRGGRGPAHALRDACLRHHAHAAARGRPGLPGARCGRRTTTPSRRSATGAGHARHRRRCACRCIATWWWRSDATGFDAVGGNVLQSVTRRRLDFAPGTRLLDPSYLPQGCTPEPQGASGAPPGAACRLHRPPHEPAAVVAAAAVALIKKKTWGTAYL